MTNPLTLTNQLCSPSNFKEQAEAVADEVA